MIPTHAHSGQAVGDGAWRVLAVMLPRTAAVQVHTDTAHTHAHTHARTHAHTHTHTDGYGRYAPRGQAIHLHTHVSGGRKGAKATETEDSEAGRY